MSFVILWLAVMFPLVFSPGPANIVFASSGANVGLKRSLALLCGIDLVFILKSIIIGFGFGGVIQQYPLVLPLLQFIGSTYIVYLAIGFLRSGLHGKDTAMKVLGFKDGVVIQLLNAKGWIMLVLMFSLFSEPAQAMFGNSAIVILIILLALLNISIHLLWVSAGEFLIKLTSAENSRKAQGIFYFVCLMAVAIWLVIDNPFWYQ